ncbi:MAG: hypothetical protein VX246_02470 [Myxococcota bacterium]|nr:hypothetical protein [Myxococcota bacterium]
MSTDDVLRSCFGMQEIRDAHFCGYCGLDRMADGMAAPVLRIHRARSGE